MNNVLKGFIKATLIMLVIFSIFYIVGYKKWEQKGVGDDIDISDYLEDEKNYYEENKVDKNDIAKAKNLYESIKFKTVEENFGEEFFSIYYGKDTLLKDELPSNFIIYLAIMNIEKSSFMTECNKEKIIPKDTVDSKIEELFGVIEYEDTSFKNETGNFTIEYNEEKKYYTVTNTSCSGIEFNKGYVETEFEEAKVNGNKIEVIEKAYYVSYTNKVDGTYILNYHSGLTKDSTIIATSNLAKIDKEKMQEYKYTFEKDKNNNYNLLKIERVL